MGPSAVSRPPSSIRDALTEAQAISGGALARPSAIPAAQVTPSRKTILIVDDDAAARAELKAALLPFYDVIEAKDGMEAAELAGKIQPPAMLVTEVTLPKVDGFTLAKVFRNHPVMKRVPVMFVAAKSGPQEVTQALVLGACQFVPKPTPVAQIVQKIRKIVI